MGTETVIPAFFVPQGKVRVKLNNPQMGTETFEVVTHPCTPEFMLVKLNNPQMGTETRSILQEQ